MMKGHNYDHGRGDICKKCGKVHVRSFETRKRIEKGMMGNKNALGHRWTEERRKRKSIALEGNKYAKGNKPNKTTFRKGGIPWNKGLTKETDERVAEYSKKLLGHDVVNPNVFNEWREKNNIVQTYPKLDYVEELGHSVRSGWERKFGLMLKRNGIEYSYESKTFRIADGDRKRRYTPDFLVKDTFVEIKGFIRAEKIRILGLFKRQYPNVKLIIVGLDNCSGYEVPFSVVPWVERKSMIKVLKEL